MRRAVYDGALQTSLQASGFDFSVEKAETVSTGVTYTELSGATGENAGLTPDLRWLGIQRRKCRGDIRTWDERDENVVCLPGDLLLIGPRVEAGLNMRDDVHSASLFIEDHLFRSALPEDFKEMSRFSTFGLKPFNSQITLAICSQLETETKSGNSGGKLYTEILVTALVADLPEPCSLILKPPAGLGAPMTFHRGNSELSTTTLMHIPMLPSKQPISRTS